MNEKSNKEGKPVKICPRAIVTSTPLFFVHKHLCLLQKYLWGYFLIWFAKFCCLTLSLLQISKWIPFAVIFFSKTRNVYARLLLLPLLLKLTHHRNCLSCRNVQLWKDLIGPDYDAYFASADPLSNFRHTLISTFIAHLIVKYNQWSC